MTRIAALCAALFGALYVALSAAATHMLTLDVIAQRRLDVALKLLIVHALAMLIVHLYSLHKKSPALAMTALGFLFGTVLFSGSLLALALGAPAWLSKIAPIGGGTLIVSWLLLAVTLLGSEARRN